MILADKIIDLRKKAGMSQEELAEQMNVSRQSVSKWEGAQSTPDLNKILQLSQIFGVSTDYLLKDNIEEMQITEKEPVSESSAALRRVSMEEANKFLSANESGAFKTALGVALCISSPIPSTILSSIVPESVTSSVGDVLFFLIIAAAVALFISSGILTKPFTYLIKEDIDTEYGVTGMVKEKKSDHEPKYTRELITGVITCILSVLPSTVIGALSDEKINEAKVEIFNSIGASATLAMVAAGVFLIVRTSKIHSAFSKLLEEGRYSPKRKAEKSYGGIASCYWLIVTAVYLAYSFITFDWGRSWIIWVIAPFLFVVTMQIAKAIRSK